ncbi:aldose 1-epimerase family protein [Ruminococcus sp.]|uniref:aldose epimerase family protein n=1 Tax=Ruminococcus sp. TaxID=41978 RepID=UPI0025E2F6B8|nr:aldose 1-epimerase family protein [Ruminococcus sp.]
MLYEIKKGNVSISADTFGAELHSIKLDDKEYLWQCGDAWKRYAPILFPFICSPKDRTYKADGKEYHLKANHGFARDSEFEFAGKTDNSISFTLKDSAETLAQYPYHFELTVTYTVEGKKVIVKNSVKNTDSRDIYFYLGGHPAFICDIQGGKCVVEYEKPETIVQPTPNGDRTVLDNETTLPLNRAQFDFDVIMKDKPNSKAVTLKKSDGGYVKLSYPQSECIAVWTSTGDERAQFICLEPWTSVPVYEDDAFEDIEKKPHAVKLGAGSTFDYSYTIEIG